MALPRTFDHYEFDDEYLDVLDDNEKKALIEHFNEEGVTDLGERSDFQREVSLRIRDGRRIASRHFGEHKSEYYAAGATLTAAATAFAIRLAFNSAKRNREIN